MCNLLCINRDGSDIFGGVLGKLHEVVYIGKCRFHRISGNSRYACVVQRMKMAFNSRKLFVGKVHIQSHFLCYHLLVITSHSTVVLCI